MIPTTYAGLPVFLCNHLHNWSEGIEASFSIPTSSVSGKSNREERESLAVELRAKMKFTGLLNGSETQELEAALDMWDNRPVLFPFWPAMTLHAGGEPSSIVGSLKVWFEDEFSNWEIGVGASPTTFTPSAKCLVAPVMWGRFGEFPTITTINGRGDHSVSFDAVETGSAAYSLRPNTRTLATNVVNAQTVPVLTVPFSWGANKAIAAVRIKRDKVGFVRADADEYYPQLVKTKQTMQFKAMDVSDTSYILTLFKDREGSTKSWQCPTNKNTANLSLGRFYSDTVTLTWEKPALAGELVGGSLEFISLPTEEISLAGETPGVDIGGTPGRWFGYVVTDGTTTLRYTSFESAIVGPGGTFQPAPISHGTITEEINLQVNDCTLEVQNWPGSPFTRLRNQLNAPTLTVTIYEGLRSNPTAAKQIYTGTAAAPDTEDSHWKIKLVGPGAMLETKGPRYIMSQTCAACIGDGKCKIVLSTIQVTKTLLSYSAGVAIFSNAGVLPDHRFAAGEAQRIVNGTIHRYLIVESYKNVDGDLACVIAGAISPAPIGTESGWILTPGCDGVWETCKGFGNTANFRGAPRMPKTNPAMVAVKSTTGGKK